MPFWENAPFRDKKSPVRVGTERQDTDSPAGNAIVLTGPQRFALERAGDNSGTIPLPSFEISPTNAEFAPELVSVRVEAISSSRDLQRAVEEAFRGQQRIDRKLNKTVTLAGGSMRWPVERPISDTAEVLIVVNYRPRNESGDLAEHEETVRARSLLFPGQDVRPQRTLRVRPRHLLKVYEREARGFGPRLIIEASPAGEIASKAHTAVGLQAAYQVPPDLRLEPSNLSAIAGEWGCISLEASVRRMLSGAGAPVRNSSSGRFTWRLVPQLELSPDDREMIARKLSADPDRKLRIPLSIVVDGAEPKPLEIEIHPMTRIRDGLLGVDLGNSSSSIAVLDPAIVDEAEVPREHFEELSRELVHLLRFSTESIRAENQSYWTALLADVCRCMELDAGAEPAETLRRHIDTEVVTSAHSERLYLALGSLERQLWSLVPTAEDPDGRRMAIFQTRLCNELHRIYHRVFETVPLKKWSIELIRRPGSRTDYTSSEMELGDVVPLPHGEVGGDVPERRLAWMAHPDSVEPRGVIADGRFFECPKQFLSEMDDDRDLTSERDGDLAVGKVKRRGSEAGEGGEEYVPLTAAEIIQATLSGLLDPSHDVSGKMEGINQVVATYPADLRPEARQRLEQTLRELGMTGVFLDFDESVSPAIFHLEQLFGSVEEIGCEAFKVQCVRRGNLWTHDMLVIDIGAGTTDVSLIRLELREYFPDHSEFGGVKYEITPRLLGAAGRSQAGGHQLTLGVFRILKQILANWILSFHGEPNVDGEGPFTFVPGHVRSPELEEALERAESVLPTRFVFDRGEDAAALAGEADQVGVLEMERPLIDGNRLNRFTALWNWAEQLKITISELLARHRNDAPRDVSLDCDRRLDVGQLLSAVLAGSPYQAATERLLEASQSAMPCFSVSLFKGLAQASIDPSIRLAANMARSALASLKTPEVADSRHAEKPMVQSIVLSGRAAALPQVQERIHEEFEIGKAKQRSPRILFRSRYAKSATVIGACRGRHRMATAFQRSGPPERLEGQCEMDLRIENLFFYLPCAYQLGNANNQLTDIVFDRHDEFRSIGQGGNGVIRSCPATVDRDSADTHEFFDRWQREIRLYRNDGDGNGVAKGLLSAEDIISRADPRDDAAVRDLRRECGTWRVRYEIDYLHRLSALFIRPAGIGGEPQTYRVNFRAPSPLKEPGIAVEANPRVKKVLDEHEGTPPLRVHLGRPDAGRPPLCADDQWREIPVLERVADESNQGPGFHQLRAWLSPTFRAELNMQGRLLIYLSTFNGRQNEVLQDVTFAPESLDQLDGAGLGFRCDYRLMVVSDGRVVLVVGSEPGYWETGDVKDWISLPPGCVLRLPMGVPSLPTDWWNNPFRGKH